jgi:hypothetical protein
MAIKGALYSGQDNSDTLMGKEQIHSALATV